MSYLRTAFVLSFLLQLSSGRSFAQNAKFVVPVKCTGTMTDSLVAVQI